ncbi:50S ribosomal protein L10 [Candidatus Saccharibacteria bacterium RIFCSPHIGHO2_01_FULL_48_12]|nr:MAG: 50S ribosomal protein L10 [Candidatus Saccharibacteria bacterium RIFCSPHIGHO2_01_FULL_48_12]OGL35299.1 MAG: 50S ribosomal protein L10 [Candidatus Saccharibacteria bacterium RIFCSPHIGHO2_12_FULL_48_21]
MAITRQKKSQIIEDTAKTLTESELVVVAKYQGTSVRSLQQLRRQARDENMTVRVVKNRLVKQALTADDRFNKNDFSFLTGQLMYASSPTDELAPAKLLADFSKNEPQVELVAGLTRDGVLLTAEDIKALAALPTLQQLRGQLAGLINSPLTGLGSVLINNLSSLPRVLTARAQLNS